MKLIKVPCVDGEHEEIVYNIDDFPYFQCLLLPCIRTHKKKSIIACPATFDIETTTIKDLERPFAFCYQWQFCLNGLVVMGRRLEEFQEFIYRLIQEMHLTDERILICYVHNLSYEFSFLKSWFLMTEVFCLDKRKVARCRMESVIEMRCSYILSNMTLAKFCENSKGVVHNKLSGNDFNYDKIRTPETELSDLELAYCYNDVKGLEECINSLLEEDTLNKIPMTSTGYVRRDFRNAMKRNRRNREKFLATRLDAELFILLHEAFRGGDTHANIPFRGND